jgi:signal transduction histidine kinase
VVADLGRRLDGTLLPEQVPQSIVDTLGTALRVQHVGLTVDGDDGETATYGRPGAEPLLVVGVTYLDEQIGTLSVTPHPRERLSERDRELLQAVARQSGVALRAARLTADLRRSRDQVVSARAEERRRLHRDLHDGLGPTLASLYQRLDAARELVREDPELVEGMLREVQTQTRGTIADLRQLVYALRPPAWTSWA